MSRERIPRRASTKKRLRSPDESRQTVDAIRSGEVDAFVIGLHGQEEVLILKPADPPYRLIVEEMGDGAATLTTEGVITYCNPELGRLLGRDRSEIVGRLFEEFVAKDLTACYGELIENGSLEKFSCELELRTVDDLRIPVLISRSLLPPNAQARCCLVITDLREQKRAREDSERQMRERAAVSRIATSLASNLRLADVLSILTSELNVTLANAAGVIFLDEEARGWVAVSQWGLDSSLVDLLRTTLNMSDFGAANHSTDLPAEFAAWPPPLVVPLRARGEVCGSIVMFSAGRPSAEGDFFYQTLGREIGFAVENARLFEEVCNSRERLQVLSRKLMDGQESERRRIALELHDQIGQTITALKFIIEAADHDGGPDLWKQEADAMLNGLMEQVRNLSLDLRPPMLDDLGLLATLRWHFERFTAHTGIGITFDHWGVESRRLHAEVETAAYRIVQEALTNVARHARSKVVTVRTWATSETLFLQIEDEGVGFDQGTTIQSMQSVGLGSIRERAELAGGQARIDSQPGTGTFIMVEIPLSTEQQSRGACE